MAVVGDTGNGATVSMTGGISSFTRDLRSISLGSRSLGMIDVSLLSSSTYMEKIPEDLADPGSVTIEFIYDTADGDFALGGSAQTTITVTFPLRAGETTAATFVGTGYVTEFELVELQNNQEQVARITFSFDGDTGPTLTASS